MWPLPAKRAVSRSGTVLVDLKKLFKGDHPLLSDPGFWVVAGHGLTGKPLHRVPIQGTMQITHEDGKIVNLGEMSVVSRSSPSTFQTSYVLSLTEDRSVLDFFQSNEPVDDLRGKVVVFDDRLVSTYVSGDGSLTGFEVLHRLGDYRYAATGSLLGNGELVNLWKLDLIRPASDELQEQRKTPAGV